MTTGCTCPTRGCGGITAVAGTPCTRCTFTARHPVPHAARRLAERLLSGPQRAPEPGTAAAGPCRGPDSCVATLGPGPAGELEAGS